MIRYGALAKSFHWLVFLLLCASIGLELSFDGMPVSPEKLRLINWHKWVGVTIFFVMWLRLGWRLVSPPPPLPASMIPWQRRVAEAVHRVLYLLLIAQPLTGWLMSTAEGFPVVYFGIWRLPTLLHKDKAAAVVLDSVHATLGWIIVAIIAFHALAALKHHFIDRDEVLARMVPGLRPRSPRSAS